MRGFVAPFAVAALAVAGIHAQTLDDGSMTGQCTVSNSVLQWEDDNFPGCGTLSYTYEGCCGNVLNASDDAVCRSAVVESAYCENTLITDGCDFTPNASDTVIFTVTTTYASAEESCCQQCKCYGDPLCLSFNGTFDEMIECDGRNLTTCQMEQDICREQYDHAGNRCKWLKGNDNYDWVSNLVSGSPCQADYNVSGQLEVNMIDVDDFSISALVGERGVITDAIIEISTVSGSFQLNSVDCFDNDPRDVGDSGAANAWTLPSGVSSLPSSWTVTTPNDVEIRWHIGDASVGIYADVICTKAMGATRSRLDIENVTDTQNRTSGDGFCFTGVIDKESQSGTNVGNIEGHYHCLAMQLPDVVTICKALTDDTCYERTLDGWQQYWCETAELEYTQASVSASTYEDMVATCLTEIRNGTEEEQASTWIQYACQMNSELAYSSNAQETYVEECVNEIEQFGWYEWEQKYEGIIVHQWTSSETCVTGIGNFTTIPDDETCAAGVMVEVYKNDEWTPILYFSPEQPPCDDADITASGEDFPDLFLYQIRLRQCGLSSSCLVAEGGTECKPTANMEVDMDFQGPSCSSSGESITTANNCTECSQNVFPSPQICDTTETWYMGECDQCCLTNNYSPGQEDQSCRDIETTQPFCDLNDTSMSDLCANLETESNNATVTLTITAPESGFDMECCESCALWGDPFGQAFDGSRQKLIICDARTSSCDFSESICDNLLDHAGNTCVWNQTVADEIGNRRANVGAYGSPCLPDWEESGEAEVVLYTVPEPLYNLSFFTGERSILTQLFLTTPRGSYSLDPEGCYGDDDYAGWTTISGDDISEALVMNYTGAGEDGYGEDERVWAVYEADMGIFFRVTCVNSQAVNSDYVGGYRLNIEHLIDTDINRTDTSGYCPTADLYQYGGQWTNNSNAVECQLKSLSDNLRACKAFWTGSCTPDQIDLGVESWCRTANQPYSVSKCVSNIYDSSDSTTTASQWTTAVCTALLPLKQSTDTDADFLRECEDLAETNGYYAIAENYGSVGERNFVNSYCASDISEYSTRDDTDACVMGISVQYESGDDEWEEVFFIPSNLLPCGNQLVIPAYESQYYPLFTNRIRLQQCDLDGSADACPAESNVEATCMSNFGFNVSLDFNYDAEGVGCTSGSS